MENINNNTWYTPGWNATMVYYLCAYGYLIYKFTSVLNNYQQNISGIIARDDNLVKSDAKKCQQYASGPDPPSDLDVMNFSLPNLS